MPDMNLPGAHIEMCLDELKFRGEECRAEARKQSTLADAFETAVRKLERAIEEEATKARPEALLQLALDHLDMEALRVSHNKDWAALVPFVRKPFPEK